VPSSRPPLPTFVIIGAQKSATRWLRTNLGKHPDVFTAPAELHFWNRPRRVAQPDGLSWYRDKFVGWEGEPIIGEATPGYMIWRHHPEKVAARMNEHLADARLIAILRNPIDRANSAMWHHIRRRRLPRDSRLVDVVRAREPADKDRLCLVSGGWYAQSLAGYADLFGDQLLVLLHDDLANDALGLFRRASAHVGAETSFAVPDLERELFINRGARKSGRYGLTTDERLAMWPYFQDDVARLEEMFGLDLSRWAPGEPSAPSGRPPMPRVSRLLERVRPRSSGERRGGPRASSAGS
jgi:hypothetical protein